MEAIKAEYVAFGGEGALADSAEFAKSLDANDELREYRSQFHFPKISAVCGPSTEGTTSNDDFLYLCGNSLGLQHHGVEAALGQELKKWRDQAVEGHFLQPNPWFEVDNVLLKDMAHIVGAKETEVVLMNTLTCNLHLLLSAFYKPAGKRTKLVAENFPFPSDTHAFVSQVQLHGLDPAIHYVNIGAGDSETPAEIPTEKFLEFIEKNGDEVAILMIGAIHFLSGQFFDIEKIVKAAHDKGIIVGVDAAHAVGNVPMQFHDWNVDFACWCTYKYLNGGPGNIGGAFVHERLAPTTTAGVSGSEITPLKGWWGHARTNRFALHRSFESAGGAAGFQLSNPSIVGMMSLSPSLRLFGEISMPRLRHKSLRLTAYLEFLLLAKLADKIAVITPSDPERRGAQLSVRILPGKLRTTTVQTNSYQCGNDLGNDADKAQKQLLYSGVMCDNRPPDILRLAPTPTYNSFEDVFTIVKKLEALF